MKVTSLINKLNNGFELVFDNYTILRHTDTDPAFYIGDKDLTITMKKGEFKIADKTVFTPCSLISVSDNQVTFDTFTIDLKEDTHTTLIFNSLSHPIQVKLLATKEEKIYGLGEHFTHLNLRGHHVKNWVEEHITRKQIYNKIIRRLLHIKPKKWPFEDYKTYFKTPSFISSSHYFCHMETSSYGVFDFTHDTYHQFTCLGPLESITFHKRHSLLELSGALCQFKGITPRLPSWVYDGMILGIQGGTKVVDDITQRMRDNDVKISAIWAQDWCGEIHTYFGKQVFWNWEHDALLYPDLKTYIKQWDSKDIKFLGYINPYLSQNGNLFKVAKENNYLVTNQDGSVFLTQATSFKFGIIDLTNQEAYNWFKTIIKSNLLDLGMMGWMADFGEYLPTDCILSQGDAETLHNQWPDLWIKLNREVFEENNLLSKALFFNRAGYSNNTKYSTLIWNGDQHVDFTDDFGMRSALRAQLSLAFSGVGISHSDIGGYTTVPGIKRSKILYLRWLEMNTFTPILRSHEGNRPTSNIQPYSDTETIQATAKFSRIYSLLKPYLIAVEKAYQAHGYPMVRPLFLHYNIHREDGFLLGKDLIIYPALDKAQTSVTVDLPKGEWIHLFTGNCYSKGTFTISCPIGTPAVFYNASSQHSQTFKTIANVINQY